MARIDPLSGLPIGRRDFRQERRQLMRAAKQDAGRAGKRQVKRVFKQAKRGRLPTAAEAPRDPITGQPVTVNIFQQPDQPTLAPGSFMEQPMSAPPLEVTDRSQTNLAQQIQNLV